MSNKSFGKVNINQFNKKETDLFSESIEYNILGNKDYSIINARSYKIKR